MITTPKMFIVATLCQGSIAMKSFFGFGKAKAPISVTAPDTRYEDNSEIEIKLRRDRNLIQIVASSTELISDYLDMLGKRQFFRYQKDNEDNMIMYVDLSENKRENPCKFDIQDITKSEDGRGYNFKLSNRHEFRKSGDNYELVPRFEEEVIYATFHLSVAPQHGHNLKSKINWEKSNQKNMKKLFDHFEVPRQARIIAARARIIAARAEAAARATQTSGVRVVEEQKIQHDAAAQKVKDDAAQKAKDAAAQKAKDAAQKFENNVRIVEGIFKYMPHLFEKWVKVQKRENISEMTVDQIVQAIRVLKDGKIKTSWDTIKWSEINPRSVVTQEIANHFKLHNRWE